MKVLVLSMNMRVSMCVTVFVRVFVVMMVSAAVQSRLVVCVQIVLRRSWHGLMRWMLLMMVLRISSAVGNTMMGATLLMAEVRNAACPRQRHGMHVLMMHMCGGRVMVRRHLLLLLLLILWWHMHPSWDG
jgi:hypothetical protein